MYEVNIEHGTHGHATIDLSKHELDNLIRFWQSDDSEIMEFTGSHRDFENGQDVVKPATLWIKPNSITSVTADDIGGDE